MANKWETIPLAEVCVRGGGNIQTGPFGSQLHADDYVEIGIPSVMPQNIGDNRIMEEGIARITLEDAKRLERYRLREGDVVYSRRGDIERRALVRSYEDGWLCGTGCLRVRFGEGIVVPEYAAFYLATHESRSWLKNHAVGATMPNLNTSILGSLPFVLPPLETQHQIASILSAYDDKIELNRRMNRTLEQMARALFKSWFMDFDPVRAKMRGEQPEGMDAETAELFPDEIVEINGREVPQGWEASKLGAIMHLDKGLSYKGAFLSDVGVPMINLGTFFAGSGFKANGLKFYSGGYKPKHVVVAGDIVVANTDLTQKREIIGSPAIIPRNIAASDVIFTHHTFAVRNKGIVGQQFIYHLMQMEDYRARVVGHAHGTTVLALPKESLLLRSCTLHGGVNNRAGGEIPRF